MIPTTARFIQYSDDPTRESATRILGIPLLCRTAVGRELHTPAEGMHVISVSCNSGPTSDCARKRRFSGSFYGAIVTVDQPLARVSCLGIKFRRSTQAWAGENDGKRTQSNHIRSASLRRAAMYPG